MYARAVDEAAETLEELRHDEWEAFAFAVAAFSAAIAATQLRPSLALPLLLGGIGVTILGLRALLRRSDLVERLAGDRDAYVIPEVYSAALRETTIERRHTFAIHIRGRLIEPLPLFAGRIAVAADDLDALASELDDPSLDLDPACAVACSRLLSDLEESPLLNADRPPDQLRSRVRQIRAGFRQRSRASDDPLSGRCSGDRSPTSRPHDGVPAT